MQTADEKKFRSNGKLLLSAEYFVLDGALALALPTRLGQTLNVSAASALPDTLSWESRDADGSLWFEGRFRLPDWTLLESNEPDTGRMLERLGKEMNRLRPGWMGEQRSVQVETHLEFPRAWGLGSSSTLVALLASWSGVHPFQLLEASFGGSGYDIACAYSQGPVLFQRHLGGAGFVHVPFKPAFRNQLYFLYLGNKQNSREGIARYRDLAAGDRSRVDKISALTWRMLLAEDLIRFEAAVEEHENLVGEALRMPLVSEIYFRDYWGKTKSLGAWGGDFALISSNRTEEETRAYFLEKGYSVFFAYDDLILS